MQVRTRPGPHLVADEEEKFSAMDRRVETAAPAPSNSQRRRVPEPVSTRRSMGENFSSSSATSRGPGSVRACIRLPY